MAYRCNPPGQQVVGVDGVRAQMHACVENIQTVLSAVGGTLEDIVSLTIYFVCRGDLPIIQEVRSAFFDPKTAPVSILIQVPGLVLPEFLVELVPIAVIPHERYSQSEE